MKIGDTSFGLTAQALGLLAMLAGDDLDAVTSALPKEEGRKWETHTYPMYNGRERGVCITFGQWISQKPILHVFFSESRNSDSLVVMHWWAEQPFNAPTLPSDGSVAWKNMKSFPFGHVGEAYLYVVSLLKDELPA